MAVQTSQPFIRGRKVCTVSIHCANVVIDRQHKASKPLVETVFPACTSIHPGRAFGTMNIQIGEASDATFQLSLVERRKRREVCVYVQSDVVFLPH